MIGQTVSHYTILEKLGGGGMGVVYKAKDTRLGRTVALKFLPPELTHDEEAKQRFIHEAQAASALQHHNICTIHDIDETPDGHLFICMDCYDGETLKKRIAKGPLPLALAIDVIIQIADGLGKAHGAGMVHRDIKPANIMVTNDEVVKIVDFGLAKLAGETRMTKTGTTVGTVSYMSPEQAGGDDVDGRSDVFSLGAVVYEVVTGHRAFPGDHEAAVLYTITNQEPIPLRKHNPALPDRLQRIVEKTLKKERAERYQSAAELLADLMVLQTEMAAPASNRKLSGRRTRRLVVTLPILALLGVGGYVGYSQLWMKNPVPVATGEEPFVVAIAPFWGQNAEALEEGEVMQALVERRLLEELGGEENVKVLGEKDMTEMPRSHAEAKATGQELGATIVLWGEVIVLRDEVEIQPYVTLVKRFEDVKDRSAGGMKANLEEPNQLTMRKTQAEQVGNIALLVAGRIYRKRDPGKALSFLRRISPPTTESLRVQGLVFSDRKDWDEAERLLKKAIDVDPSDAYAYANMGHVYANQRKYDEAVAWYKRALESDPSLGLPYYSMGWVCFAQGKLEDAVSWYKKAIDVDPTISSAYRGMGLVSWRQGQLEDAVAWLNKAIELEPSDAGPYGDMALVLQGQGKREEAVTWLKKAIDLEPYNIWCYSSLIWEYGYMGQYAAAEAWYRKAIEVDSTSALPFDAVGFLYMSLGRFSEAVAPLRRVTQLDPGNEYDYLWYFISLHGAGSREEARVFIRQRAQALKGDAWISYYSIKPLVRFYAGELTEEALLDKARADDPREDKELKCEAYCYVGLAQLVGAHAPADTAKAVDYFRRCVQTGVTHFGEYQLARRAIERLTTP